MMGLFRHTYVSLGMLLCFVFHLAASEHHGQVSFGGVPVPGATVTAIHDGKQYSTVTDSQGVYSFPDLADGPWSIRVEMLCFSTIKQDIVVAPNSPAAKWELKLLPRTEIKATTQSTTAIATIRPPVNSVPPTAAKPNADAPKPQKETEDMAASDPNQTPSDDGFLINGSRNNGASSPFAQSAAFGNNRFGGKGLFNGGLALILDNSTLDARSFSITGQDTPKPSYNRLQGVATFGGPIRIRRLFQSPLNVFAIYQWTRNRNATTQSALMPDAALRDGNLSRFLNPVLDPTTGSPFPGNIIPQNRISPQAQALLNLYPLPNFNGNTQYNYQIPIVGATHQDALQTRFNKTLGQRDQVFGMFAFQSTRSDSSNVFHMLDTSDTLGINTRINWSHRFRQRLFMNVGYQFSRLSTRVTPFFENRENISGNAGISGNNQDPANWGPPSLNFSSGIESLSDVQSAFNRNQTSGLSYSLLWSRSRHNITVGGDFRRQQFNYFSQQDPRGTFSFTGTATGSDFGGFLLGIPDASSIAFGNADKYFRESVSDAYLADDWRVNSELTLNIGVRWEYGAPITELYGRLVNLDITPGFGAVVPVLANDPTGSLTGQNYPDSLVRPDKSGIEPRVGLAWRPLAGSSLVIRAGYGLYRDTSVYQTIANQMAQQSPLSKSLTVQNSAASPLTLANGFNASPTTTPNTFAIDPNFRVGYAQNWQVSAQRDLPGSLQMVATYLGIKGTRGVQEFFPNTYPAGGLNPCPICSSGYIYETSNGNSTRQSAQIQLRRRLHNGFTATLQYTFSKSIDNDSALGGGGAQGTSNASQGSSAPSSSNTDTSTQSAASTQAPAAKPAQNWLNLRAERSLSSFDQRHLLNLQVQYTSGMGMRGGTLLSGWKGALFKEWTFLNQITIGSGLPLTPIYPAVINGTGATCCIRPDYTGAPLYSAPPGLFLNPAAYVIPAPGQWGTAGRNSITGPSQFTWNASLGRTFRLNDRFNLDLRIDSTNALNHVTFASWNTTVTSTQFGLPAVANPMRSMQTTLRVRF